MCIDTQSTVINASISRSTQNYSRFPAIASPEEIKIVPKRVFGFPCSKSVVSDAMNDSAMGIETYHFYRKVLHHIDSGTFPEEKVVLQETEHLSSRRRCKETDEKSGNVLFHGAHAAMSKRELNQGDNFEAARRQWSLS